MSASRPQLQTLAGIWVPLVTPFCNGSLDERSVRALTRYYISAGATGFVLAGTTGESLTISDDETLRLVDVVQEESGGALPVLLGLCGSNTAKLVETVSKRNGWNIDGYLVTAPYYTRPTQEGLYLHYRALADVSDHPVALYNIPYRTCVNLENETVFRLAEHPRIMAIKDCCANAAQTEDLIRRAPNGFSVLVGDDANFFANAVMGAKGGILASAHIAPATYVDILKKIQSGDTEAARIIWDRFSSNIPMLFKYPNPAPVKAVLKDKGLISSEEVRLPLLPVPSDYRQELRDHFSQFALV